MDFLLALYPCPAHRLLCVSGICFAGGTHAGKREAGGLRIFSVLIFMHVAHVVETLLTTSPCCSTSVMMGGWSNARLPRPRAVLFWHMGDGGTSMYFVYMYIDMVDCTCLPWCDV